MPPYLVTKLLDLTPTHTVEVGKPGRTNSLGLTPIGKVNGWFLSSEEHVKSKDIRRHIDWIIEKLQDSLDGLRTLQEQARCSNVCQLSLLDTVRWWLCNPLASTDARIGAVEFGNYNRFCRLQ